MSNYISLKIQFIHDEDYKEMEHVCRILSDAKLLDEYSSLWNSGGWELEEGEMKTILEKYKYIQKIEGCGTKNKQGMIHCTECSFTKGTDKCDNHRKMYGLIQIMDGDE